jgi:hypothetical protein
MQVRRTILASLAAALLIVAACSSVYPVHIGGLPIVPCDLDSWLARNQDLPAHLRPVRAEDLDRAPVVITQPPVAYPAIAKRAGWSGAVSIGALVDSAGRVQDVEVESVTLTPPAVPDTTEGRVTRATLTDGFVHAATAAARNTVYEPAAKNGQPVPSWVCYPVIFRLPRR